MEEFNNDEEKLSKEYFFKDIKAADAMSVGNRANAFMAYGAAKGMQQGGTGAAMMGMMNMQAMQGFQQQPNPQPGMGPDAYNTQQPVSQPQQGGADKLIEMKKLLDAGVISQEEFDAAKQQFMGN